MYIEILICRQNETCKCYTVYIVERPQYAFIHVLLIKTCKSCYICVQMYTKQIKRSKCLLHSGNLKNRFYVRIWGPLDID